MKKIESREQYFKEKHNYLGLHITLLISRIVGISIYVIFLAYIVFYTIDVSMVLFLPFDFKEFSNITRIVIPIYTFYWILLRIVEKIWHKRLYYYKKKLEVIDEI